VIEPLLKMLDARLKHFTRMTAMEMENGAGERDARWKQRTQYLQGRTEGLAEAIDVIRKCCGADCRLLPPPIDTQKEGEKK